MNQYQACLYLPECIFHCGFKSGHEISQFWHFFTNLFNFWPVVCTRLPRGKQATERRMGSIYRSPVMCYGIRMYSTQIVSVEYQLKSCQHVVVKWGWVPQKHLILIATHPYPHPYPPQQILCCYCDSFEALWQ